MTKFLFNSQYTTCYKDNDENRFILNPLNNFNEGTYKKMLPNGITYWGKYSLKQMNDKLLIDDFEVIPFENGLIFKPRKDQHNSIFWEFDIEAQDKCMIPDDNKMRDFFFNN